MRALRFVPLIVAGLAACSSDTTSPTQEVDISAIVSQMSAGGVSYASAGISAAAGIPVSIGAPTGGPPPCGYSAASQRFECTPMTFNGMTMTRSFQLLDAAGRALSEPDPAAVASIRSTMDMQGTMTPPPGTPPGPAITMTRHEDATMSGLGTSEHVMNATSTMQTQVNHDGMSFSSNESSTTTNLRLPPPPSTLSAARPYPLGGTITTDRTFSPSATGNPITSHEVIAFDGTSVMTMTRTSNGVTMTCRVDLAKPGTMPACS